MWLATFLLTQLLNLQSQIWWTSHSFLHQLSSWIVTLPLLVTCDLLLDTRYSHRLHSHNIIILYLCNLGYNVTLRSTCPQCVATLIQSCMWPIPFSSPLGKVTYLSRMQPFSQCTIIFQSHILLVTCDLIYMHYLVVTPLSTCACSLYKLTTPLLF